MAQSIPGNDIPTDDLRRMIEGAFRDTPRPSGQLTSLGEKYADGRAMEELFDSRHWSTFCASDLVAFKDYQVFFTAEAHRYYLPAYMLASLDTSEDASELNYFTVIHLICSSEDQYRREKMSVFSREERVAIRAFLSRRQNFLDIGDSLVNALQGYWAN